VKGVQELYNSEGRKNVKDFILIHERKQNPMQTNATASSPMIVSTTSPFVNMNLIAVPIPGPTSLHWVLFTFMA
jgi:hypothetical protein